MKNKNSAELKAVKKEYKVLSSMASKAAARAGIFTEKDLDKAVHEVKKAIAEPDRK